MFKNVSKRYKIFIISVSCVLLALAIVLITLFYTTQNNIKNYLSLDVLHLPQENKIDLDSSSDYLGQPDMVRTKTGKYIVVYPEGHGHGSLIMQTSMDGKNFTKQECPESWKNSQEVPTIYTLDRIDGSQYIILISGKPYWVADNLKADGFQYSLSKDDGEIWSEFTTVYSPMDCIVAMSSLTQLKENGEFVDKWMGTFHTHKFVNYKTILSFDENDDVVWSEPEPILSEYREIEKKNKLCEIEIIRAHNDTLIMLTRNEARGGKTSMISYSNDEGESWTKPVYLPYDLSDYIQLNIIFLSPLCFVHLANILHALIHVIWKDYEQLKILLHWPSFHCKSWLEEKHFEYNALRQDFPEVMISSLHLLFRQNHRQLMYHQNLVIQTIQYHHDYEYSLHKTILWVKKDN